MTPESESIDKLAATVGSSADKARRSRLIACEAAERALAALADARPPRVVRRSADGTRRLHPTLLAIAEELAVIPRCSLLALGVLRARLAARHGADLCSLNGLYRGLAALAAVVAADLYAGRDARWPIWRVVNDNGQLPGNWLLDARWRASMLRGEGHTIRFRSGRWYVA